MEANEHQQKLMQAFAEVLKAEDAVSSSKVKLAEVTIPLQQAVNQAEHSLGKAWQEVERLMAETGEYEVLLPGTVTDYKIGWSNPPERVKADADAVPDEFCKIERKPKLREIMDYLKTLGAEGKPLPNWVSFERGERKLCWKAVKHKATAK
jgi:hypothetical protein